ncbi:OPT/YSL family transporter [Thermophilibacter provencensis]|uniref:OPT/YSL family transporter n=1 Tax=Thermophilibacter provencensis TaxID=1852386 RepID=A0A921GDU2_9ACTN|nr:OPT/YSL family transporter [Thermophilibacter provencensis]HJF44268.1 OPT/YSL family transporter [Thermophilibacter provencensis]
MSKSGSRASWREQLSPVGIAIGCVGCVIITASSVYTALKMGALPWPTIFTSIVALFLLRAFGRRSLNEANVTQIVMSAGSMVAGGLAFTIPGIWMLGLADEVSWVEMLVVALSGTLLGLVCTAAIRRRFVDESDLEYPIGTAAAETLMATKTGGVTGKRLFGSMGLAGLWCVARDALGWMPTLVAQLPIPGVSFAIYNSPQMLSVGFLVGGFTVAFWLLGALVGNFGIIVGGSAAGLWDVTTAQGIVSSLGMGLMMGSGAGVVLKDILPHAARVLRGRRVAGDKDGAAAAASGWGRLERGTLALMVAAAALLVCIGLGLGPVVAVVVVLLAFVTTIMSAQSVGQTGIDPMEIFGLIVLLAVAAFSSASQVQLFYVAGVVAVACGLAGDVMSDFKTGAIIGTSPRAMWVGQAIGALLGTVVAVAVLVTLFSAYGPGAFGSGQMFVSAQASVVATMVSGIPSVSGFVIGLLGGVALYWAGLPAMMFGLGVYLPFYMSLTAALGAGVRWVYERVCAARGVADSEEKGVVVASGVLGGESIVGVVIALSSVLTGLAG